MDLFFVLQAAFRFRAVGQKLVSPAEPAHTMKTKLTERAVPLPVLSTLNLQLSTRFAQGTALSFQGWLDNGTSNFVNGERANRHVILPPDQTMNDNS